MSVARNQYALSNTYTVRLHHPSSNGLDSTFIYDVASSPTIAVAFGGIYVSAASAFKGYQSTDGINWSTITSAPTTAIYAVVYGNNTFVAVGASGAIYTSPGTNVATWTARTKAGSVTGDFHFLKYLNGYFWARQVSGNLMYSTDGITWTEVTGSSFATTTSTRALNAKLQNLTYYQKQYIYWTGHSATTSQARLYFSAESSISDGSWSNTRVYTDTQATSPISDDPGDSLGPVARVPGGTIQASTFLRLSREYVYNSNDSSQLNNMYSAGRIWLFPYNATATVGPIPYPDSSGQGYYLKYTDGNYFSMVPASHQLSGTNNVWGLMYQNHNESGIVPVNSSYSLEEKPLFLPLFANAGNLTLFRHCPREFTVAGRTFLWWTFNATATIGMQESNLVTEIIRAIRPLKTTIDVR